MFYDDLINGKVTHVEFYEKFRERYGVEIIEQDWSKRFIICSEVLECCDCEFSTKMSEFNPRCLFSEDDIEDCKWLFPEDFI